MRIKSARVIDSGGNWPDHLRAGEVVVVRNIGGRFPIERATVLSVNGSRVRVRSVDRQQDYTAPRGECYRQGADDPGAMFD